MGMVFQGFALWPHLTVFDNIAFGLVLRHLGRDHIRERVAATLALVDLAGLERAYPSQLSGGQQQRVALARSLVVEPGTLLLDEPLSSLDAKLRLRMRGELKDLQRRVGITFIHVTHDEAEARAIADRVAVMDAGRILRVGAPAEVLED
jgi:iron(III) transport system ATP-binding protein